MGRKIVAFSAGRKHGNTEVYIKIALTEAKKMGLDVELIRLNECNLQPCKACPAMPCMAKGPFGCILKDDGEWLMNKFLESDGYLLGAPVWSLSPCGIVTDFRDRLFGPKMDVAIWALNGGAPEWTKDRSQHRPGALISVGGALTENWTSLGLATLYTTTFSAQINVIDHLNVYAVADPGEALTRKDYLQRAKYLGQNLAYAVLHPEIDWTKRYLGETLEEEACPGCHNSLLIAKPGRDYVECAICGTKGKVKMEDGGPCFVWQEDDNDRLTVQGKFRHIREIEYHTKEIYEPLKAEIEEQYLQIKNNTDFIVRPQK
jgi:multimeric flavodoxin WrbA